MCCFQTRRIQGLSSLWILLFLLLLPVSTLGALPPQARVPDQLLVKFHPRLAPATIPDRARIHKATPTRSIDRLNIHIWRVPEARLEQVLAALKADPEVEFAEPDWLAQCAWLPNDPKVQSGEQWHLARIGAPQAWDVATGHSDRVVAVVDSGAKADHPDLAGRLLPGFDFVRRDSDPDDEHGHGTAVAGVVAAAGNNGVGGAGVAFQSSILPVKVTDASNNAPYSLLAEGIAYAVDRGARVINVSIGGPSASRTLQSAVDDAWKAGAVIIAAAGNSGTSAPLYPAACDHVLAVGATDASDRLAWFSSFGTHIALTAPGVGIWTTLRDPARPYGIEEGTSFAAPMVAGTAALMLAANPALAGHDLIALLKSSAEDLGAPGTDNFFGAGRLNAGRAVTAAKAGSPAPTRPRVLITHPAAGESVLGSNLLLAAEAAIDRGTVVSVDFLANGAPVGASSAAPFTVPWAPTRTGAYVLTAVALSDQGLAATSAPVLVRIVYPDTNPPSLLITSAPPTSVKLTNSLLRLRGLARDNRGVDRVELQLNSGPFQAVSGTTQWTAEVELSPGTNVVRLRGIDTRGNISTVIKRTYFYSVRVPLTVRTLGWGRVEPPLDGQRLEVGRTYTVRAVPGADQAFVGWPGAVPEQPLLRFLMASNLVLTAEFVPSPFPAVRGTYTGLAADPAVAQPDSTFGFRLTLTRTGGFTGSLRNRGLLYPFQGRFSLDGQACVKVARQGNPFQLAMQLDLVHGSGRIIGSITDLHHSAELAADRAIFHSLTNPAPQAGLRQFLLVSGTPEMTHSLPARARIYSSGSVIVVFRLPDGRVFTHSTRLAADGVLPFYRWLGNTPELLAGWLEAPAGPSNVLGSLLWTRAGTNGFTRTLQATPPPLPSP